MFDERKLVSIYTPIQYSLKRVKNELRKRYISSGIKPVYGKLLRPTIALFASHSFEKKDHSKDVILATALELIHNASLIHDDILDDEFMRRSDSALHIPLGLKKALLFGDSLFTQALKMIQELDHPTILSSII
ncbi:MAG: polyprenyl synthetase family protein, partial [candidate division WOR-3 bacterium]